MISQEQFNRIESEHGCGYWNICWEHACPCAITTENKGLSQDLWNGFVEENRQLVEQDEAEGLFLDDPLDDYYDFLEDDEQDDDWDEEISEQDKL